MQNIRMTCPKDTREMVLLYLAKRIHSRKCPKNLASILSGYFKIPRVCTSFDAFYDWLSLGVLGEFIFSAIFL
jgi:hypothetical protein